MKPGPKRKPFNEYVERSDGCWLWLGAVNRDGYGRFTENRRGVLAHRRAWELHNNASASGYVVMHKCDNPACCNPEHLILGSHSENQKDKARKNRQAKGSEVGGALLTEDQVVAIRNEYSFRSCTYKALAHKYGVCKDTIQKAVRGINWRHINA